MLIDWFTVGAQALNFLILVWLLRHFLYRPVLAAIEAREKKVTAKLVDAAAREAQAQSERDDFRRRNEAFDRDREILLGKAAEEAANERQRLVEAARQDSLLLRSRLTESLGRERAELNRRLLILTQEEVLALARDTLKDLAGITLEDRMIEVFIAHLRELRPKLAAADLAVVRSAFEISPAQRPALEAAIRDSLGADVNIQVEIAPALVCGVEVRVSGVRLAWSVADRLSAISGKLAALAAAPLTEPEPASVAPSAPTPTKQPAVATQHAS
jgi:F-type H+-transporting ATPase subunit b